MSAQTHALLITPETETVLVPHLLDNPQTHDGPLTDTEVRGVDVLPKILGPLMGGEDIDIDVRPPPSLPHLSLHPSLPPSRRRLTFLPPPLVPPHAPRPAGDGEAAGGPPVPA